MPAMARKGYEDELSVVTVCGVGMGSSLIMRMTAEKVFAKLGLKAHVLATDVSSAMSMRPDIVIGQAMHTPEFEGKAPIVISVDNFVSEEEMRTKLLVALEGLGWLAA
jgi:PTS system ascorbate-specific IIB component